MPHDEPIEIDGDRRALIVRGTYGKKDKGRSVWVSRIDGWGTKFSYARTFLGDSRPVTVTWGAESWTEQHVVVPIAQLKHEDLLQISIGKWARSFWQYLDYDGFNEIEALDDKRFRQLLGLRFGSKAKVERDPNAPAERMFRDTEDE